jgi:hypothetical protein
MAMPLPAALNLLTGHKRGLNRPALALGEKWR